MASGVERGPNWWLVLGGVALIVCGGAVFAAPGLFLELITVWAGVAFFVSGVAGIASYVRLHRAGIPAGWDLFMAILDFVVGVVLVLHPYALASVIPWMLGASFVVFGVAELAGMVSFARSIPEIRTVSVVAGLLSAVAGIMLIVWPESLSLWVAAFALVRGVTLVALGFMFHGRIS